MRFLWRLYSASYRTRRCGACRLERHPRWSEHATFHATCNLVVAGAEGRRSEGRSEQEWKCRTHAHTCALDRSEVRDQSKSVEALKRKEERANRERRRGGQRSKASARSVRPALQ